MNFSISMETFLKEETIEKPKCFDPCIDQNCDMKEDHCSIKDYPPMNRCCKCEFWFTNMERKQYTERVKTAAVLESLAEITPKPVIIKVGGNRQQRRRKKK